MADTPEQIVARIRARLPQLINEHTAPPSMTLREILAGVSGELNAQPHGERRPDNIAHYFQQNPAELAALEQRLGANRQFGFQGVGDRAIALTFLDDKGERQILRLTRHPEGALPNSQSFSAGERTDFRGTTLAVNRPALPLDELVEKGVITKAEAERVNERLRVEVARDGLVYNDVHTGNGAISSDGRAVVLDPGAVTAEAAERTRLQQHFANNPANRDHFLAEIDKHKAAAATLTPLNNGIEPTAIRTNIVPAAAPPVAPHAAPPVATPHAPTDPHVGTRTARGGIVPALVVGAGVGVISMFNGATPASAALTAGTVAADGLVPGVTTGFNGITDKNVRTVDRILNIADTTTGTVATGAALTALVPGTQHIALPAAGIAATANVGVGLLRDAAYVTGLGDHGGIVTAGVNAAIDANAQRKLIGSVTDALVAGRVTPETQRIADLRDNVLLQQQQIRALDQYDPNHRDNLRRTVQAPPPYKDPATGRVLTNLRDIQTAMRLQEHQLQRTYADAITATARDNPNAIAALTGTPAAPPPAAPSVVAQFGTNFSAITDPNLSTAPRPPAVNIPVVATATTVPEKKPEPAAVVAAAPATAPRPAV